MIEEAWRALFSDDTDQKPSISQMQKEIEKTTAPDGKMPGDDEGYWWDETMAPENKLEMLRAFLSNDCQSYTPSGKAEHIEHGDLENYNLVRKAQRLGINIVKEKISSLAELRDRVNQLTGSGN